LSLSMIFVPRFSTCTSYVCLLSPLITGMAFFTHVILPTVYYYGVGLAESPFLLLKLVSMP
jgi:hypothetical protein